MTNIQNDTNMGLFILVEDEKPVNHPVTGSNLTMFFPDFDPENPPSPFEKFKRVAIPHFTQMEKHAGTTYEKIDGIWQDVHHIEPLSQEEKDQKLSEWQARNPKPYPSWIIDEDNLKWVPPIPYPQDNEIYAWDEDEEKWQKQATNTTQATYVTIRDINELPVNGPLDVNSLYILVNENGSTTIYIWKNNDWKIKKQTTSQIKLSDQMIISAELNDQQVKVMGVVPNFTDLNNNYQGEIADAYIIDNINQLAAWNGSTWEIVQVKDSK